MGEKELLVRLWAQLGSSTPAAWRDDCVIRRIGPDQMLAYSVDRPELIYATGDRKKDLLLFGRWAAALTASDVIACGVEPLGIAFDIGMEALDGDELLIWARGVAEVCDRYGMIYEGGNLGMGGGVTGMCYGVAGPDKIIRRSGAGIGDYVVVTGAVGTGWAKRLWSARRPSHPLPLPWLDEYQHHPWIDLDVFRKIWSLGAITCGMDLTDGVIEFGYEILEQSGFDVEFARPSSFPEAVRTVAREFDLPQWAFLFEPGYDTPFAHGWCVRETALTDTIGLLREGRVPHVVVGRVRSAEGRGPHLRDGTGATVTLPRYWDDVCVHRGSVARWEAEILPLFSQNTGEAAGSGPT